MHQCLPSIYLGCGQPLRPAPLEGTPVQGVLDSMPVLWPWGEGRRERREGRMMVRSDKAQKYMHSYLIQLICIQFFNLIQFFTHFYYIMCESLHLFITQLDLTISEQNKKNMIQFLLEMMVCFYVIFYFIYLYYLTHHLVHSLSTWRCGERCEWPKLNCYQDTGSLHCPGYTFVSQNY